MTELIDIVRQYPIKNRIWTLLDTCFCTDMSLFEKSNLDPWNRKFAEPLAVYKNKEGEITHWLAFTTVNGDEIRCRIFNT